MINKKKQCLSSLLLGIVVLNLLPSKVMAINSSPIQGEPEIVNEENTENGKPQLRAQVGAIDIIATFPDVNFQATLQYFDTDNDGFLSPEEISSITSLTLKNITDLTGIKTLTSLKNLDISFSQLTQIDLNGMSSIEDLEYSNNPNLTTLDLRNCPNLISAHHSVNGETVWISAGMIKYIGCDIIHEHTGDINIDLKGIATINPDGSKQVDLSTIISPELLEVFKENNQPGFNPDTNILIIPKGEESSDYTAGKDNSGNSTTWTFYTDKDNPEPPAVAGGDVTTHYIDTDGNPISDDVVNSGNIGDKYTTEQKDIDGYTFKEMGKDSAAVSGDFEDKAQTVTYVYTKNPVAAADVTAKYVDTEGNKISDDVVNSGNIGDKYTTEQKDIDGYTFKEMGKDSAAVSGDFIDKVQTVTYVYTKDKVNTVTPTPVDKKPSYKENTHKSIPSSSTHDTLPKTGENERMTLMSVGTGLFLLMIALIASIFRFKRFKNNK